MLVGTLDPLNKLLSQALDISLIQSGDLLSPIFLGLKSQLQMMVLIGMFWKLLGPQFILDGTSGNQILL